MNQEKILITGSLGQIGSELSFALKKIYGENAVITSDIRSVDKVDSEFLPYENLNVLDRQQIANVIKKHKNGTRLVITL